MTCGVELEQKNALDDIAASANERGLTVTLQDISEENVERGEYGSVIKRTPTDIVLKANPVVYSPTTEQLDKAGIRDTVDVLVTLPMGSLITANIDYMSFDEIRWRVFLEGETFVIKGKNRIDRFGSIFLNIVLGLTKV